MTRPLRQHSAKVHTAFRIRVGLLTMYMLTAALCVTSLFTSLAIHFSQELYVSGPTLVRLPIPGPHSLTSSLHQVRRHVLARNATLINDLSFLQSVWRYSFYSPPNPCVTQFHACSPPHLMPISDRMSSAPGGLIVPSAPLPLDAPTHARATRSWARRTRPSTWICSTNVLTVT